MRGVHDLGKNKENIDFFTAILCLIRTIRLIPEHKNKTISQK